MIIRTILTVILIIKKKNHINMNAVIITMTITGIHIAKKMNHINKNISTLIIIVSNLFQITKTIMKI